MASQYEVEVTLTSARDLKNVNWRYGDLKPYAVVWIDPAAKCSTKVDIEGDTNPVWDEKLTIPLPHDRRVEDSTLFIDVVHARSDGEDDTKPLIGSARLPLRDVLDEAGVGGKCVRSLKLKRPSGRPHGKIEVKVAVKEPARYYDRYAYNAPPYGQPAGSRDYQAAPYGAPPASGYGQPPQYGYGQPYTAATAPAGYPYSAPPAYGAAPSYGAPPPVYGGQPGYAADGYGGGSAAYVEEKKKSKFGMGTGLAVGAVAGVLGGLALAEGIDYVEDKIEDNVAERVEDDLAYEDGGYDDF